MRAAKQSEAVDTRSAYFHKMIQRCEARAAAAASDDDRAYWLGLAQIWSRVADREEK
jgi:hypothetical protein